MARGGRGTSELYPTAGDPPATALEGGFIQLQLEQAGLAQLAGQPRAIGSAHPRPLVPIR